MNPNRIIKAAPGRTVRDPVDMSIVTQSAKSVPDSPFWRKRIKDGDVVEMPLADLVKPVEIDTVQQAAGGKKSK